MALPINIPFETLVQLVSQLPVEQRQVLIARVQQAETSLLTDRLLSFQVDEWDERMTLRREDEYGDDAVPR